MSVTSLYASYVRLIMGNVSIDVSLANIWKCWFLFRKGKKATPTIDEFSFYLEENLRRLENSIQNSTYQHSGYATFVVSDNKRRDVSVASVRDRVVHRILYEYLVEIYDKTFIFDVWSCRKEKGLLGAINRAEHFLTHFPRSFIWRTDIRKFFDNVDHVVLTEILTFRISDPVALKLLMTVINSYRVPNRERERE